MIVCFNPNQYERDFSSALNEGGYLGTSLLYANVQAQAPNTKKCYLKRFLFHKKYTSHILTQLQIVSALQKSAQ